MNRLFQTINCGISFDASNRHWIELGQTINTGKGRQLRLMCDRVDNKYVAVFAEESSQPTRYFNVEDGRWLSLPTVNGLLQVLPKVLRFDGERRVDAVLLEIAKLNQRTRTT